MDQTIAEQAGLNTRCGLEMCLGNVKLYQCLLLNFYCTNSTFSNNFKIAQQTLENDPNAMTRCAHTLKGTAANIGAVHVHRAAETLELICKENGSFIEIEKALQITLNALNPVLAVIDMLDSQLPTADHGEASITTHSLNEELKSLAQLLIDSDIDCVNSAANIASKCINSPHANHVQTIKNLTTSLEFSKALAVVRELLSVISKME